MLSEWDPERQCTEPRQVPRDSGVTRFTAKLLAHGGLASWKATLRVPAD